MYVEPRILIIGNSESGKSTVGRIVAEHLGTQQTSTSQMIVAEYTQAGHVTEDDVRQMKRSEAGRMELFRFANAIRDAGDPAHFAMRCLEHGSVVDGVRTPVEFAAARVHFDLCLWKEGGTPNGTDHLAKDNADFVIPHFDDGWETALREWLLAHLPGWLATPNGYVAGPYRAWQPNGEYDTDVMASRATDAAAWAKLLRGWGLRAFDPVNLFRPLDTWWGDKSARKILALCRIQAARFRPRDFVLLRYGWHDSAGVEEELPVLREETERIAYAEAGADNVQDYLAAFT